MIQKELNSASTTIHKIIHEDLSAYEIISLTLSFHNLTENQKA